MSQVMRTVKIPECMNPFYVEVNGHKYSYPAGTTQEVPEDVAAVIEAHEGVHHHGYHGPVHNQSMNIRPDWSVNDPGDLRFVRNRPCYEETAVLFDQRVEFTEEEGIMGCRYPFGEYLEEAKYLVTYNGEEYECDAVDIGAGAPCALGNLAVIGGNDTGEPFLIVVYDNDGDGSTEIDVCGFSGNASASVKIELVDITKLHHKYLPDGYPYVGDAVVFNQMVEIAEIAGHDWYYAWYGYAPLYDQIAEKATVIFDGVSYPVTVWGIEGSKNVGDIAITELHEYDKYSYPFSIEIKKDGNLNIYSREKITTTVKILVPEVHPIDPKFLPGGGGVMLYPDEFGHLYRDKVLSEENELSRDDLLAYARSCTTVVINTGYDQNYPDSTYEKYDYVNSIYTVDDYASVYVGDGRYFYSSEYVAGGSAPV